MQELGPLGHGRGRTTKRQRVVYIIRSSRRKPGSHLERQDDHVRYTVWRLRDYRDVPLRYFAQTSYDRGSLGVDGGGEQLSPLLPVHGKAVVLRSAPVCLGEFPSVGTWSTPGVEGAIAGPRALDKGFVTLEATLPREDVFEYCLKNGRWLLFVNNVILHSP